MKKIFALCLFLALTLTLTAAIPPLAKSPAPVSSWYSSPSYTGASLVLYGNEWFAFNATSFETQSNGFYVLENNTFKTTYSGMVKLTGACVQGKVSQIKLRATTANGSILLAETLEVVFTFLAIFPAGDLVIEGYNEYAGRYDELRCTILLEKVQ